VAIVTRIGNPATFFTDGLGIQFVVFSNQPSG